MTLWSRRRHIALPQLFGLSDQNSRPRATQECSLQPNGSVIFSGPCLNRKPPKLAGKMPRIDGSLPNSAPPIKYFTHFSMLIIHNVSHALKVSIMNAQSCLQIVWIKVGELPIGCYFFFFHFEKCSANFSNSNLSETERKIACQLMDKNCEPHTVFAYISKCAFSELLKCP